MIKVELSVHKLVDLVLRSGDIDDRYFNNETMNEGVRIHSIYQKKYGSNYQPEVFLAYSFYYRDFQFNLKGRCDGLIIDENKIIIDEIKTSNQDLETFQSNNLLWHLGQVQVYGLIYCLKFDLDEIDLRLTYISQVKKEQKIIDYHYKKEELKSIVEKIFDGYIKYLKVDQFYKEKRDISLKKMSFPFKNPRKGQLEISNITLKCIENKSIGFIEGSTGIGKTVSFLYGAFEGLKNKQCNYIFYLTAKNSGFLAVFDQIRRLIEKGIYVRSIALYAKEKACLNENKIKRCNPDECPFAKDYYTKLNEVLIDCVTNDVFFDKEKINRYALKYNVCPFELSLDLSKMCDLIVCDYNYIFHPIANLKRFFEVPFEEREQYAFLIDEAHNLVSRSRDMYSSLLSYNLVLNAYKEVETNKRMSKLKKLLNELLSCFDRYSIILTDEVNYHEILFLEPSFNKILIKINDLSRNYRKKKSIKLKKNCEELLLEIYKFTTIYSLISNNFKIYLAKENNDLYIKIFCLDASNFINEKIKNSGALFFSGTLTPINYYEKTLINDKKVSEHYFASPYNPNNLKILIDSSVSMYYKDRKSTINQVFQEILKFVSYKVGNYLIFCPSFIYLKELKEFFKTLNYNLFVQGDNINKEYEKNNFFEFFSNDKKEISIGLCVLGGSYSEGIDIKEGALDGAVILGIGLPNFDIQNSLIEKYYNEKEMNGFEYAYFNPGLNKVMQAIGRIIRNENDKGVALLIDKRFGYYNYKTILDAKYKNKAYISYSNLEIPLKEFYLNYKK